MDRNSHSPRFVRQIPDGDTSTRSVCETCGFIHYENPKVVVGSVVTCEDRILLCRRAIDPRKGYWTLPAGYMELNESTEDAARREAREEANALIRIDALLAVYSIARISQVQIIYRATLENRDIAPGVESLEVALLPWADIPWQDLAFPSVRWALTQFRSVRDKQVFAPFANPDGETGDLVPGQAGL